ncbi:MAG: PQQ-binding-like beta-propeller repeat protein [Anaerolineales bacterium]|nr:PQQ-binding-like beta-propeller repeat protein [Anaerolineales bacterium]
MQNSTGEKQELKVFSWVGDRIFAELPDDPIGDRIAVEQLTIFGRRLSKARGFVVQPDETPAAPYAYSVPVQSESPWPASRRDERNSGRSPVPAVYYEDQPWMFQTGGGIYATPVIDSQGVIYFGSTDHTFYALKADGSEEWSFKTNGDIAASAVLGRFDPILEFSPVTFVSGDGYVYQLRTGEAATEEDRLLWRYQAVSEPDPSYNHQAGIGINYDGTMYASSANYTYYALNKDGSLRWTYGTGSNNWAVPAVDHDGTLFIGSADTYVHAVDAAGQTIWKKGTLGFLAASASIGRDGTIYIGSFDSNLYALDALTGEVSWKFSTGDQIFGSAALGEDAWGQTTAIYFASTDGFLYALTPQGKLMWEFDTAGTIRSSPVLGRDPDGKSDILYFGAGNGKLYALNAADGSLRWIFNTTSEDPDLRNRNELNASPALGLTGIYNGSENGQLWYVPYDYCLHSEDTRCVLQPELPDDFSGLYYVSQGGDLQEDFPLELSSSSMLALRLLVRKDGESIAARICNQPVGCPKNVFDVRIQPFSSLSVEQSADGRYLFVRPRHFLEPGEYTLTVSGTYFTGGTRIGNLTMGGDQAGEFSSQFHFAVPAPQGTVPLSLDETQTFSFQLTRFAYPSPPMMSSLNQAGFDGMVWIAGTVAVSPPDEFNQGRAVLWIVGGKEDENGNLSADPESSYLLPLNGRFYGKDFVFTNREFNMAVTGLNIPFELFELRGTLTEDGVVLAPVVYAESDVMSVPGLGPYMVIAGLANNWYEKMPVAGTFVSRPFTGTAAFAPAGITVERLQYNAAARHSDGRIEVNFSLDPEVEYPIDRHRASILLLDPSGPDAVFMDYATNTRQFDDQNGNLKTVLLTIPAGMKIPPGVQVYVLLDVYPIHSQLLR